MLGFTVHGVAQFHTLGITMNDSPLINKKFHILSLIVFYSLAVVEFIASKTAEMNGDILLPPNGKGAPVTLHQGYVISALCFIVASMSLVYLIKNYKRKR